MPLVMNALDDEQRVTVGGNTFTFKPRQIKQIYQNEIATVITRIKGEFGFVGLPDELEYIVHVKDERLIAPEHKVIIEEARRNGVDNYVKRLRELAYNAQVSLRQDLEKMNIKADPKVFASEGDVQIMKQLVKYQTKKEDDSQKRVDTLKELEKQLEKIDGR